jgi:hypothetical protein
MLLSMTPTDELIRELERTRDETLRYFSLGDADLARTYAPGKWSVRHLLNHLTDSEIVLAERVRRDDRSRATPLRTGWHEGIRA